MCIELSIFVEEAKVEKWSAMVAINFDDCSETTNAPHDIRWRHRQIPLGFKGLAGEISYHTFNKVSIFLQIFCHFAGFTLDSLHCRPFIVEASGPEALY